MAKRTELMPTSFRGVTYRTRIEARWAVFFDRLGVTFHYKPEKLELPDRQCCTPTFYVHEFEAYIWVFASSSEILIEESELAFKLFKSEQVNHVWLIMGPPNPEIANILDFSWCDVDPDFDPRSYSSVTELLFDEGIRSTMLEDRRDKFIYWLATDDGGRTYSIGGPGAVTDHDKWPLNHRSVEAAYLKSAHAFKRGWVEHPW